VTLWLVLLTRFCETTFEDSLEALHGEQEKDDMYHPAQIYDRVPGKFRVGQKVRILHGFRGLIAEIIEDRGPIGAHRRRLYAVKFRVDPWNEYSTEMPEDSLEAVSDEINSTELPENGAAAKA
jgi:hypothetical protein